MTLVNVITVVLVVIVLVLTLVVRHRLKRDVEDAEGFEGVNSDGQLGEEEEAQVVFRLDEDEDNDVGGIIHSPDGRNGEVLPR